MAMSILIALARVDAIEEIATVAVSSSKYRFLPTNIDSDGGSCRLWLLLLLLLW